MTNGPPFKEDRTEFCSQCKQHYACANCTAEQCNDQGDELFDDDRPDDEPGHNGFGALGYWENRS